jgi:xylulokinase
VNAFAHVNHTEKDRRLGILLCINGTGIMNSWVKKMCGDGLTYKEMDAISSSISPGCDGLFVLPFGNGAERMLQNKIVGAQIENIDLNNHAKAHIFRAVQEGIAFAFRYGLDIMRENYLHPTVIRAGKSNLFSSDVFVHSFVNATGVPVELYSNDGSVGAALGAGVGACTYKNFQEAFSQFKPLKKVEPTNTKLYDDLYHTWK